MPQGGGEGVSEVVVRFTGFASRFLCEGGIWLFSWSKVFSDTKFMSPLCFSWITLLSFVFSIVILSK